jgi:hypothetical protein
VHFTREPIVETIITPKEGYKLSIKSSKGESREEYLVDAVEVISFGQTFFYRSLERPKSFLVPVSDYEVSEVKELRLVVKNPSIEKSIKIAGGKENHQSTQRHQPKVQEPLEHLESDLAFEARSEAPPPVVSIKRDRKRQRRNKRIAQDDKQQGRERIESKSATEEVVVPSVIFSSLLTPPNTLISETLFRSPAVNDVMARNAKLAKNLEAPANQESLSGSVVVDDYQDPLFSTPRSERIIEDQGLASEEPKIAERLEEEREPAENLNDHSHLH